MFRLVFLLVLLCVATIWASHQNWPGNSERPVLSDSEAALYTKDKYLNGWKPETIQHTKADYTVGSGHYSTIQEAVNAAVEHGGTARKYIHVEKGVYKDIVLIPKTTVPITIYGTVGSPGDVHIKNSIHANMKGSEWAKLVNPDGKRFKKGDPAYNNYLGCANRATIGNCATLLWVQSDNFEMQYITVENPSTAAQALAARIDGQKQHIDHCLLYGFQDTLMVGGQYIYVADSIIKGDVDFIFGPGPAVFEGCRIIARGDRPRSLGVVFAPDTKKNQKYGFLAMGCEITATDGVKEKKGAFLARAWDTNSDANGQVVIRQCTIDDVINVNEPWDTAAGGRKYHGNANKNRNLDDSNYNRFWEYKNTGGGA